MGMRILGMQAAINGFDRLKKEMPRAASDGVTEGIGLVFEQSQVEVPKKTGALAGTGHIVAIKTHGYTRSKGVRYGEPGEGEGVIDYAAAVHEILKARHELPTKAKYVEDPLVQNLRKTKKATANASKDAVKRSFR